MPQACCSRRRCNRPSVSQSSHFGKQGPHTPSVQERTQPQSQKTTALRPSKEEAFFSKSNVQRRAQLNRGQVRRREVRYLESCQKYKIGVMHLSTLLIFCLSRHRASKTTIWVSVRLVLRVMYFCLWNLWYVEILATSFWHSAWRLRRP